MAKLRPGQPLNAITSRDWNRFVDVADWYERFKRLGDGASPAMNVYGQTAFLVRNNTAGNVDAGAVVEISGTDITDMRRDQMMFNGIVRGGVDPFCGVYLEAVQDGQFGRCVVSGAVIASVNIVDSDNTHARVEIGSTLLKGDFGGWCRILYKPGGTGVKTCVVAVGHSENIVRKARASELIVDGSSGNVNIFVNGASRGTATAHFNWMTGSGDIPNNSDLFVQYFHDEDKWVIVGAGCAT